MKDVKNLSDEDLVLYMKEKEKEGYVELVKRYQDKLLYFDNLSKDYN